MAREEGGSERLRLSWQRQLNRAPHPTAAPALQENSELQFIFLTPQVRPLSILSRTRPAAPALALR